MRALMSAMVGKTCQNICEMTMMRRKVITRVTKMRTGQTILMKNIFSLTRVAEFLFAFEILLPPIY